MRNLKRITIVKGSNCNMIDDPQEITPEIMDYFYKSLNEFEGSNLNSNQDHYKTYLRS